MTSSEFYAVIKHVYILFACLDLKGTKGEGVIMKPPSAPTIKGFFFFFFYFLPWGTFDLLHFYCLWFPTPIFQRSNVLGESRSVARAEREAAVCEKAEDFFCPPENCFEGFITPINTWIWMWIQHRPWPLLSPSEEKINVFVGILRISTR